MAPRDCAPDRSYISFRPAPAKGGLDLKYFSFDLILNYQHPDGFPGSATPEEYGPRVEPEQPVTAKNQR
jgi:hypothetical protein